MKSTLSVLSAFEKSADKWITSLNEYSEKQFAVKPGADSWSIGQLYMHLVAGTQRYQLKQVALCIEGKGTNIKGGKKFPGRLAFFLGSFPSVRIKVPPSDTYTPRQPGTIEEIRSGLNGLIKAMRDIEPQLSKSSYLQKTLHPALGYLNAREWFQLIEMHFRHHMRQKKRIDSFLAKQTK